MTYNFVKVTIFFFSMEFDCKGCTKLCYRTTWIFCMGFSSTPEKLHDFMYLNFRIHKYNTQMYWIYILSSVRAFLNCGDQNWTQYTMSGLTLSWMITSLSLLVMCLHMQPRIHFVSIVAVAHCLC